MSDQKREPSCDCITRFNEALSADGENTMIETSMWMNMETQERSVRVKIPTWKPDQRSRKRMVPIQADFCPFCGVRYGWKPLPAAAEMARAGATMLPGLDGGS